MSASRVPDMPTGWPRAMAPPFTLTMSSLMPRSSVEAQADGGECLVDLEQVDVADAEPGLVQGHRRGVGRLVEQRRAGTGHLAVADQLAERGHAQLLGLGPGHDDDGGAAVGDLARRCRR